MSKGSNTTRSGGANSTRATATNGSRQVDVAKVIADANEAVDWWRSKKSDFNVTSIKEENDRVVVRANSGIMNGSIDYEPEEGGASVDDNLYWRAPRGTDYYDYKEYVQNLHGHTYDVVHRAFPNKKIHITVN